MGAAITNTLEVAGVVADAFGDSGAGDAARAKNAAAAGKLARADRLETEADWRDASAELDAMEAALAGRRAVGEARAGFAAGGVRVDSGSAADAADDAAAWGEYDHARAKRLAEAQSWGVRSDAAALRGEAAQLLSAPARGSGRGNKLRSLLGTGSAFFATGAGKIIVKPESAFI